MHGKGEFSKIKESICIPIKIANICNISNGLVVVKLKQDLMYILNQFPHTYTKRLLI